MENSVRRREETFQKVLFTLISQELLITDLLSGL